MIARLLRGLCLSTPLIVGGLTFFQIREERDRLLLDLQRRATLLADGLRDSVEPLARRGPATPAVERVLKRLGRSDRRIVVYDALGTAVTVVPEDGVASVLPSLPEAVEAILGKSSRGKLRRIDGRDTYVHAVPLLANERPVGALAVFFDAAYLKAAERAVWEHNVIRFLIIGCGMSLITIVVVRASVTRPLSAMADWAKQLKAGRVVPPPTVGDARLFGPLAVEMTGLARSLYRARAAAEQEAALRLSGEALWTEERLKQFVRASFDGRALFVVSNREPVSHVRQDGHVTVQMPASGVVTAMEPVMRACGGVWVAHGSGSADRETADDRGRLALPPDDPRYTLRRVWLSAGEEAGYYYGLANEGLWPLCHVVHARPTFRPEDWAQYRAVNMKFAEALLEEMEDTEAPLVLVQDYHFALLPALVKAARPDARVAIFWHIPWPNFEAFGICPWQHEILAGMLAADLIGFHTQYHCNNFLETVDRALEARIDADHFAVWRGSHVTSVKPFPISVAPDFVDDPPAVSRPELLAQLGVTTELLGVGVERVDYTKGLPERFLALRRFFERFPEYRERLTFVQVAAPSRSEIPRYRELRDEVRATVDAVNDAVGTRGWRPIVYLERHHDRRDIWPLYRHADFCVVSSLHDGMNLVAKEFVSVRDDHGGALILSRFTGAARELREALLVNPYDLDETADAIRAAVEMPAAERTRRMARMHAQVREQNIYRWAGMLLGELARIPADVPVAR